MKKTYLFFFILFLSTSLSSAQMAIDTNGTANQMAQMLAGSGVLVSNAVLNCHSSAKGLFTNGSTTNLGIDSGIVLTTGSAFNVNNSAAFHSSIGLSLPGESMMFTYGVTTGPISYDACILEFDLIPIGDSVRIKFVFGSEEFPEYVSPTNTSPYYDAFAFFISGPGVALGTNMAKIPGTNFPININTVNRGMYNCPNPPSGCTNCSYYVDNCSGTTIVYDAFTTAISRAQAVTSGQTYHLKMVIIDGGDLNFDSGVFIEGGSISSTENGILGVALNSFDGTENCNDGQIQFCLANALPNDTTFYFVIEGSAVNGVDYTWIADSLVFPSGTQCLNIPIVATSDGLLETDETVRIIYQPNTSSPFDTITILVHDALILNNLAMCDGIQESIIASAGLAGTFLWSPSTGLSDPDSLTTNVLLNLSGTSAETFIYYLTFSGLNCAQTDSVEVTVFPNPIPNVGSTQTICAGDTIQIGGAPLFGNSYLWSPSDGLSNAVNASTNAYPDSSISYTLLQTIDSTSCSATNSVTITVHQLPNPVIFLNWPLLSVGPFETYQWSENGTDIVGANSSDYLPTEDGLYTVTVSDSNGCIATSEIVTYLLGLADRLEAATFLHSHYDAANHKIRLSIRAAEPSNAFIKVMDLQGRVLLKMKLKLEEGINEFEIDSGQFASGLYLLECQDQTHSTSSKLFIGN